MNECIGYYGRWFGHKFESFEVERLPPQDLTEIRPILDTYRLPGDDMRLIRSLTVVKSSVQCVRCGETK